MQRDSSRCVTGCRGMPAYVASRTNLLATECIWGAVWAIIAYPDPGGPIYRVPYEPWGVKTFSCSKSASEHAAACSLSFSFTFTYLKM